MDELWDDKSFRSAVYGEFFCVTLTCIFALAGLWGLFAALALVAVLLPLWVCAVASSAVAFRIHSKEGQA